MKYKFMYNLQALQLFDIHLPPLHGVLSHRHPQSSDHWSSAPLNGLPLLGAYIHLEEDDPPK